MPDLLLVAAGYLVQHYTSRKITSPGASLAKRAVVTFLERHIWRP